MVKIIIGLSPIRVPNFITFYYTVLGAAIEFNGRIIISRKGRNTMGSPISIIK